MDDALTIQRWRHIGFAWCIEIMRCDYPNLVDYLADHAESVEVLRTASYEATDAVLAPCLETMDVWNRRGDLKLMQTIVAHRWAKNSGLTTHQPSWLAL